MFKSQIKSVIIAGALAMGAFAASSSAANADVRGGIYFGGPNFSIGFGNHGHYGFRDWDRPRYRVNRCNPRKAVRKARRKGLRRAHVVRVGHRGVIVAGRKWGDRVVVGFGRHRSCPVRFVRHR